MFYVEKCKRWGFFWMYVMAWFNDGTASSAKKKVIVISMCCNLHKNLRPSFNVFIYFLFHLLCSFLRSLSFCSSLNVSFVTELVDWDRTSSYLAKSISYPLGFLQPVCLMLRGLLLLYVWFVACACTYLHPLNFAKLIFPNFFCTQHISYLKSGLCMYLCGLR